MNSTVKDVSEKRSDDSPVLYLLMRTDMKSMNPGKGMAQAHHAGTAIASQMEGHSLYTEWRGQQGFGYVYTLACTENEIDEVQEEVTKLSGGPWEQEGPSLEAEGKAFFGEILDPTYPIRDGDVTHYIPVVTCAWLFGRKKDVAPLVEGLKLHK